MILLLPGLLAAAFLPCRSEAAAGATNAVTGRVIKTLPLFLDLQGHDALSPSLFDRDAYQAYLRQHTNEISAIRFDVLWKASNAKGADIETARRTARRRRTQHAAPDGFGNGSDARLLSQLDAAEAGRR